jgi:hypothetical protein
MDILYATFLEFSSKIRNICGRNYRRCPNIPPGGLQKGGKNGILPELRTNFGEFTL